MTDVSHEQYDVDYVSEILAETKSIAVVGASPKNIRPSYFVVKYLLSKGYDVMPVNPGHAGRTICEVMTFASLSQIDRPVDMVDIFRNSTAALAVVQEALLLDPLPKVIWMQLGVFNQEAANLAENAGIKVVMNRCPKIEYARISGEIGWAGVNSGVLSSQKPVLKKGYQSFGIAAKWPSQT
ncbi:MAG: CoA-binding protein [Hyphomicrobiales bacterium]|nr:CoA-binding protein [Hyphomicrobiales bacterium]